VGMKVGERVDIGWDESDRPFVRSGIWIPLLPALLAELLSSL